MKEDKKEKIKKKTAEILGSAGYTAIAFSLTATLTGLTDSPDYLKYCTGSLIVGTPVIYGVGQIIKRKIEEKRIKEHSHINQIFLMNAQLLEPDYQITSMQTVFLNKIDQGIKENNIDPNKLSGFEPININQFLYLINSNYYEKITKNHPNISREKLIKLIITQIMSYYKDKDTITFNEKAAKDILDKCFFINNKLKKEIHKDFKKSKIKIGKLTNYAIVRNNIEPTLKAYSEKSKEERNGKVTLFDIDNPHWYFMSINIVANDKNMQEYYGECEKLKWDVDFLQKVITLTARKYRERLIEEHEDYTNFDLALTLIEKATSYAMVNKKETVRKEEIINSFKAWTYVPFDIQMDVLDDIFVLEDLDYDMHPYGKRQASKPKENVLKMSDFRYQM